MNKLVKVARGFLELLLLRATGESPREVAATLQPTLDMREFYASSQLITTSGGATTGSIAVQLNDVLVFTVLLGVKAIGATFICGAAAATNVTLSVGIRIESNEFVPCGSIFLAAVAANQVVYFGVPVPSWVVPAGAQVQAAVSGTAAGADHSLDVHALIENYNLLG